MVFTPFIDKQFMRFAKSLKVDTKVGLRNGKKWGKFILRECFESDVGANIAWQKEICPRGRIGIYDSKKYPITRMQI